MKLSKAAKIWINYHKTQARIIKRYLPYPRIRHSHPEQRLRVITQGRSPVR